MSPILSGITRAFDVMLAPFAGLNPWVGLLVVSVVTGVVMLLIFGKTSNQKKITETKDKLKAYIMEMWIFRNDTLVMFSAIGNVIRSNLQYLRHSLRPLLFIFVPVLVIMVQLGIRYGNQPFEPGDTTILSVELSDGVRPTDADVELTSSMGLRVLSPPLRIDAEHQVDWKLQALMPGTHEIALRVGDEVLTKSVAVGPERRVETLADIRPTAGTWSAFLYPSEAPIPRGSVVKAIRVGYPARELGLFGLNVHWLLAFFVVSVVAGFALKGVFGIDV
jgi:uncharacterized membrane protein (DUF106 family)